MIIYNGFSDPRLKERPRALAIGVFDGVHLGHRKILERLTAHARRHRLSPCVVTFDPHPERVLSASRRTGQVPGVLLSLRHRLRLFALHGARECVVVRFDRAFSRVSAADFVERKLLDRLKMRALFVGEGFRFGRHAQGSSESLRRDARRLGFYFEAVQPLRRKGRVVSSTRIRRLIAAGRLRDASMLLGRTYGVIGDVVRGRGRGRTIGFPTANLDPHHEILPPPAVYAAVGILPDGKRLPAVVHIGQRPTFGDGERALEVHFPGLRKSLYKKEIEVEFVARLRSVRRFRNPADLRRAIEGDIRRALRLLFPLHAAKGRV